MPPPFQLNSQGVDLSTRFKETHAVVGSPALAAETTIASLTITDDMQMANGALLEAWAAFTVGTSGTAATMKIHHTNASGATIASTGALTVVAANLVTFSCQGIDQAVVLPGQIFIVTLQITAGAAVSTVSAVSLFCTLV